MQQGDDRYAKAAETAHKLAPEATTQCLREAVRDCGREVPDREIDAATEKAFASPSSSNPMSIEILQEPKIL
ncbi:MAG: hypothetical protein KJ072_29060, partial [Verrucomicrobia bacterium]|nr:hypothetical protein [Verrucomicrobiota bacterium]